MILIMIFFNDSMIFFGRKNEFSTGVPGFPKVLILVLGR